MRACLDSWAMLCWLDGEEPGAGVVDTALARERPVVSWINLVEVHYRTAEHAELLTGDPEIIDLAKKLPCEVRDLRPVHD